MAFHLITAGAGFIGSNIVAELVRRGERVVEGVETCCTRGAEALQERSLTPLAESGIIC